MKAKLTCLTTAALVAISMNAQLTIEKNNHIVVGTPYQSGSTVITTDSLASISILGRNANNYGGYITFGAKNNVSIGEYVSGSVPYYLMLKGNNGIVYNDQTKRVFAYSRTTQTPTFDFYCPVKAQGVLLSSDARLKSNVKSLEGEWEKLMNLNPVSYTLTSAQGNASTSGEAGKLEDGQSSGTSSDAKDAASKVNARVQYGYIAQELKDVFPDLVMEDEEGYYSVDYIGLIPLLVDAVKNLSTEVELLKHENQMAPATKKTATGVDGIETITNSLSQNRPNPFDATTVIDCTIEEEVKEAFIGIYDLQGKQIIKENIIERGKISVNIDNSKLIPGIYMYALIVDGIEVSVKRMILSD